MNSTNGTVVNGQVVQKHLLKHGDTIEIGKHTIRYILDAAVASTYQDFAKTMVIRRPNDMAAQSADAAHQPEPAPQPHVAAPAPALSLASLAPPVAPAESVAPVAPVLAPTPPAAPTVPAAPAAPNPARDAALQVLSGPAVGRVLELNKSLTTIGKAGSQVAVFTKRPSGFYITHVEGDVFPLVNGVSLGAQAQQLNDQDTIEIAGTKMSFFYKP